MGVKTASGLQDKADRQKYWKELDIEEKIERMREVMKSNMYFQEANTERINKISNHFYKHQHDSKGDMMAPLKEYGDDSYSLSNKIGGKIGLGINNDEIYF